MAKKSNPTNGFTNSKVAMPKPLNTTDVRVKKPTTSSLFKKGGK